MKRIKKIIRKLKEGALQEVIKELIWIYGYGLRYKGAVLWYIFLGIFGTGMSLGAGVISKYIIDAVTGYDSSAIIPAGIFYVLMELLQIGSSAWTNRISTKIQIRVDQEIRADVYDKIMEADWQAMSEYHSGDLLNRVDGDAGKVSASVLGWVPNFITRIVQFFGTLGIILYYDTVLAGLALLSAPISVMVSGYLMRRLRRYNIQMREASSRLMTFNEESFQNIQMIKSFGLTDLYGGKLRDVQKQYQGIQLDYNKFSIFTTSFMSFVGTAVSIICYGWGVYRLWGGHITYGTMTLFLQLAGSLSAAFSSLVALVPSAISAATAAGRLMAVTELPKEDRKDDKAAEQILQNSRECGITVQAEKIGFHYRNGENIFSQADLIAKPGEIVALVGPSGEGKTTMLRVLLGIVNVQQGAVHVRGRQDSLPVSASTRRLFAYVPQGNTMFAGTIGENLRIMKEDASDEELNHVLKLACAYEFVYKSPEGLNSLIKERGGGFSEGQIQRLSIARALLADAPVLLLDEATSALDVATERKVLRNIMNAKTRKTCIVTTHRPSVLGICSRVYRISGGTVAVVDEEDVKQMMIDF